MIEIPLANGKGVCFVDDEDNWVLRHSWHIHKSGTKTYARTWINGRREYLHRMILEADLVDHINGDGLDNRRDNLRPADRSLNSLNSVLRSDNTSGEKNVNWMSRAKKFAVGFQRHGVRYHVGLFETLEDAVSARDKALESFQL